MNRNPRAVLFDVDETIAHVDATILSYINMCYDKELARLGFDSLELSDLNAWGYGDKIAELGKEAGWKDSVQMCIDLGDRMWEACYDAPATSNNHIPLVDPYIPSVIQNMRELNYEIHIVTARRTIGAIEEWLKIQKISYDNLVFEQHKERLPYLFLVEDDPTLIGRLHTERPNHAAPYDDWILLLRDRPWNRELNGKILADDHHTKRIHTSLQILPFIQSYSQHRFLT